MLQLLPRILRAISARDQAGGVILSEVVHINPVYPWNCGSESGMEWATTNEKDVTCPDCNRLKLIAEHGTYRPSFPRTKFADSPYLKPQLDHILSESREAEKAYYDEPTEAFIMELMDLLHSIETALHICSDRIDLSAIKRQVIEKNQVRGYYK